MAVLAAFASDWGGWMGVQSTLSFWQKWLVESVRHSAPEAWPGVAKRFYVTADPAASALAVALLVASLCFLLSLPTNNHSFVDKIWSLIPIYYTWHYTLHDKLHHWAVPLNPRLLAMGALTTVWGLRLTYNFARKGGYRWSAEDYRWPYIRAKVSAPTFLLFNLTFIAFYQNLLLLGLTAPAYLAWQNVGTPLSELDAAALALAAFFVAFEAVADQQQWRFQSAKHSLLAARKRLTGELAVGFPTSGLWRYSRHPNFWAEQSLWCSMYLFGVAASGRWLNWTLAAPLQLILLFQGSTSLTEKLSADKYPGYRSYQLTTSCFFPWPPAKPSGPAAPAATPTAASRKQPARGRRSSDAGPSAAAEAAPPPSAAPKRRSARARQAKPAEEEEPAPAAPERPARSPRKKARVPAAEEEPAPPTSERPARSARKSVRAREAEEQPAPARQSSRLRAKAA